MRAVTSSWLFRLCLLALLSPPAPLYARRAKQKPAGARKSYEGYLAQAQAAMAAQNYQDAIDGFEGAYQSVRDPALLFNIGTAHRRAGRPTEALLAYERFVTAAPQHELRPEAERHMTEMRARLEEQRGQGLFEAQKYDQALAAWQATLRLRPSPRVELRVGAAQHKLGLRDAAIASIEHALAGELEPRERTEAERQLRLLGSQRDEQRAQELERSGQYEQAAGLWAAAHRQRPAPELLYRQAQAHQRARQYREALKVLDRLLNEELPAPRRAEIEDQAALCRARIEGERAQAQYQRGRYDEAVARWDEAMKIRDVGHFVFMQARAHRRAGRAEAALRRYQDYLRRQDSAGEALDRQEAEAAVVELRRYLDAERDAEAARRPPLHRRGWFIGLMCGAAALVGAGVATGLIVGLPKTAPLPDDLGGPIPVRFP